MRRVRYFFNGLFTFLRRLRGAGPEDIAKKLPPEELAKVMAEARFLFGTHGVDVRVLGPGEKPQGPRPAEDGATPPGYVPPED